MAVARVARRLAAILAADVVGYSRLMEADEAGTFARLKALRRELIEPVLQEHGGRFVDLKGDGAIVEFQSVTSAVEAAVAIQRAMRVREPDLPEDRRIRYRIGINLGDVIIDGETIEGDGINIAARIEASVRAGRGLGLAQRLQPGQGQARTRFRRRPASTGSRTSREPVETFRVALGRRHAVSVRPRAPTVATLRAGGCGRPVHGRVSCGDLVALAGRSGECCALDRGPAVRQSRRRRGDGPTGRGADRGHHHRSRPLPRPRRHRPQLDRRFTAALRSTSARSAADLEAATSWKARSSARVIMCGSRRSSLMRAREPTHGPNAGTGPRPTCSRSRPRSRSGWLARSAVMVCLRARSMAAAKRKRPGDLKPTIYGHSATKR